MTLKQSIPLNETAVLPISSSQRFLAYIAMLLFGLPSVLIALAGGEIWPFLDYRMYAEAKLSPSIDWLELVGHPENGPPISLNDASYFAPFDPSDLLTALYSLDVLSQPTSTRAELALRELFTIYEKRRLEGRHSGPALHTLDVYRIQWTAQPGLSNYDQPNSWDHLHSVSQPLATP